MNQFLKKVVQNDQGVALLMVMGFISILTALLVDFSFETRINTSKAYNSQDRVQARLNAEAGLNFALGELKIYQIARNRLEKEEKAKGILTPSLIESVLTRPFMFPIIAPPGAGVSQKSALSEFEKKTFLQGQFQLFITPVKGFLNPNSLRIPIEKPDSNDSTGGFSQDRNQGQDQNNAKKQPHQYIEEQMIKLIQNILNEFRETNDPFLKEFPNIVPRMLVKEMKFFVNNPDNMKEPEKFEIQANYNQENIMPKHAPLSSLSELNYLLGWPEYLLEKVKRQLTVHEVGFISLNDLDKDGLTLIFPQISPEQIEEFFRYRDGDAELGELPKPFKTVEEFKSLVTSRLSVVSASAYEERAKEFEQGNLKFGVAGKLYKVVSTGVFNTAKVKLTAFVDLPVKDPPKKPETGTGDPIVEEVNPDDDLDDQDLNDQVDPPPSTPTGQDESKEIKLELLAPRIIEIQVD